MQNDLAGESLRRRRSRAIPNRSGQRALLDPAASASGRGVAHDLTRVADRLQIAGDDFVERRSFRAGDLDDATSRRRERHIGDDRSNVVRRDGLEQGGRKPDDVWVYRRAVMRTTRPNSSRQVIE